ncbi:MAG TPA: 16S rRNA (guanine(527)-N(7))-methyltransferase RsmG [Candidatus Limnocylindria bacterium]|nr:16S rRNA (guanine(527)-N(7))-methyltransferase RsmG [Candidatus Limnocylindria bacterium]
MAVGAAVVGAAVAVAGAAVAGGGVRGAAVGAGVGTGVGAGVGGGGVGVVAARTTTVPRIVGWTAQWYGKVPAAPNTTCLLCPIARFPVLNAFVSLVAVCVAASVFVHVTVSPTLTVTVCGRNCAFEIVTEAGAASAAPALASSSATAATMIRTGIRTIPAVPAAGAAGPFAALAADAARFGLALSPEQVSSCARYAEVLTEANTRVNLTAITEPADIATKHFLDAFTAYGVRRWTGTERLVDVGSGAGFPGLALRIALSGIRVTLVESVGKKARFLEETAAALGIAGVAVRNARAEDVAREAGERASYDVATARAVGTLGACVEYLLPLLRVGGEALVWKGRLEGELEGAERALSAIGGQISAVVPTTALGVGDLLPGRRIVVIRKTRPTPQRYPRTSAEAKRRPW